MKKFSFIIVAGGRGSRLGARKQFLKLGEKFLWQWSADEADKLKNSGVEEIILVVPSDLDLENFSWSGGLSFKVVHGGATRSESVLNGLNAAACDYVLIHDAARPFAKKNLFLALMNATDEFTGAIPVLPVADALKKIDEEGEKISIVNREGLFITQTPQSFHRKKLIEAVKQNLNAKDEAESWHNAGYELAAVEGQRLNFKITWQEDMTMAKSLVEFQNQNPKIIRTGIGYDVHQLVPERKLILGGVEIQNSPLGLLGHSDADLLTHAIMDSILGAAGLEDIGNIFPASDEKFRNADSIELLKKVLRLVEEAGWRVEFVDAVVEAQVPRLNKYREEIKSTLEKFFACNIKFKSAENLNDAGRGLSMTCWACATVSLRS
ncbi:MAG: 2-C-methyl-D-erythritol 2,4-cyclodiphosphate synthase [Synergistaceae bacterium]|nr:2-C-methyl-D-erythritol 2,4-cyclodiphosphate synthase [Synergistaceae bacterium]